MLGSGRMPLESINPTNGERLASYEELSGEAVSTALTHVHAAFGSWRRTPVETRSAGLRRLAQVLRAQAESLARLMALEMGKPLAQGRAEVEKCAWVCEHYAQHGPAMIAPEIIPTDAARSYVAFEPLGVLLAVMPWNFPFWQVFRCVAPAFMAGNAVVLKHASNVSGCALAIERVVRQAGLPEHLFRTLLVPSSRVGQLIEHPLVRAVTLTGSTPAGQAVAAKAGSLLKKTVLELGGSDPYVVLADADLELAATTCVSARLINGGQSCIAAKRFIVEEPIRGRFEELVVGCMRAQRLGDPLDERTTLGPMARRDLRDELHDQVERSVACGAKLLLGGEIPPGAGTFYPPTVLTAVHRGLPVFDEETFGPVAAIVPAANEAEAIRLANDSPFGLGAAVFTRDLAKGEHIAREALEAGCVFVNASVRSDPRLPFGGIKESGYGRELGVFGLREFVNIKTVYVK
jgi:succinate-semialdehyde dehydrogenase/glutarate-semialdehyde dehydrogenase